MSPLFGGIEAGGTKFICAVGSGPHDLITKRIPTTTPEETITRVIDFFREQPSISAVGIGSFGPLDLDHSSPTYGYITTTPKSGWMFTDIVGKIERALQIPVGFDTDVNSAALGEYKWGAARGLANFIYLTIGTGIGGGGMMNGKLMHGLIHPEMGHILIPHDKSSDPYQGCCPFHSDCLEGLASGSAIEQRWKQRGENLASDHPAWTLEAEYLGIALGNIVCTLSPERIIVGGGVMKQTQLLAMVWKNVVQMLGGYIQANEILKDIDNYIVPPELGTQSGILGAIALAKEVLDMKGATPNY
jgi:fructokinase